MGQVEGSILVEPITGNFLFPAVGDKPLASMDPRVGKQFNQARAPYTTDSLAAAIRDGKDSSGRVMSVLMPRYDLSPTEIQSLINYLRQLSVRPEPGVSHENIRIATVITPDVDPIRRKTMIDMVQSIVRQKNSSTVTGRQNRTRHHMVSAAEMILGTERSWTLDIWELKGSPQTWKTQLSELYAAHPVFAIISGLSHSTWQPVHDFCDVEQVPCWFPSVAVPGEQTSPYAFYFSGGVTLEATVLAKHLLSQTTKPSRVTQIYRDDTVGQTGSKALVHALKGSSISVNSVVLNADLPPAEALKMAMKGLSQKDVVMFWLRPTDIEGLHGMKPVHRNHYFSGSLSMAEMAPLDEVWSQHSHLVYLYELPEKRAKNLEYFHIWLNVRKIPLVDEVMQSEVFFAFNFLSDTVAEMLNNLHREYLIERAETMMSKREASKAEQETRDRLALGRTGELINRRGVPNMKEAFRVKILKHNEETVKSDGTTIYPRLSLGPEQRLASKGAYIVRFADKNRKTLIAETTLIVP
jgi:hypothetical protein